MKKRTRYLLIVIGFIFFLITAPLIVLYVGGITYDFSQNRYVKTGILVVNTEPNGAKLFIDELPEGSTPKRVKFLKPGEHTVSLTKDGYFSWTKRLEIKSEKVTWAAAGVDNVNLLKSENQPKNITTDCIDFAFTNDGLIYLSSNQIVFVNNDDITNNDNLTPPVPVKNIEISPNKQLALLRGDNAIVILDVNTKQFYNLSEILANNQGLSFSSTNELFYLQDGILASFNWQDQNSTTITTGVKSFTTAENSVYVLKETVANNLALQVFARNNNPKEAQTLIDNLPNFNTSELLVTKYKEILILGDGSAYRVNAELSKLADGIINWQYNPDTNGLLLASSSELNQYDFAGGSVQLISRSSNQFSAPLLQNNIGYAFFGQGQELVALELDRRDVQNRYILKSPSDVKKILSTSNSRYLYVQDGTALMKLEIRE